MKRWSVAALVIAGAAWLRLGPVPNIETIATPTIVDRGGVVLYEPLSRNGTRSELMTSIPENVARATVVAEDRRFDAHLGVDPIAVGRALLHNLRRGRVIEGGSTITQQVAKLILPPAPRTMTRKLREAIVALRLEHRYSKAQILALYLNLAPYGEQTVGIARASQRYFGCAPEQLTIAQAAYLAGLPQRPGTPRRALHRQRAILAKLRDAHWISDSEFALARAERLTFDRARPEILAQHFVERVLSGAPAPSPARLMRTTLDAQLQRDVLGILSTAQAELRRHAAQSVAVAVLDNRSGEWLAWEGSGDYFGTEFGGAIDGLTTPRQPGSTLKPFTYALAFEQGFAPATAIADVPAHYATAEEGVVYTPRNYDGHYRGPLRARAALAGSENVPAVALLARVGPPSLLRFLRQAGFGDLTRTADYYGLGLTLGDAEVTLEQLITAYAMFARGGIPVQPRMVIANRQPTFANRLVSQRTSFWITDILSDANAREYIFGSGGSLDFPFPVAVKTGTSQAYHDNWTIGYTREVTVGVWVGNFDRRPLHNSSGITGAAPIFHDVMLAAMKRVGGNGGNIVDRPSDLERQPVCALSGLRPSTSCPNVESEWLPADARVEFCSWHHEHRLVLPSEYRAWDSRGPRTAIRESRIRVLNPPDGATYLIDPTLRREFQSVRLRASKSVTWLVDGRRVAPEWSLAPGHHTIVATDAAGERDSVRIYVK